MANECFHGHHDLDLSLPFDHLCHCRFKEIQCVMEILYSQGKTVNFDLDHQNLIRTSLNPN